MTTILFIKIRDGARIILRDIDQAKTGATFAQRVHGRAGYYGNGSLWRKLFVV
jgi:hypothetical protein